VLPEQAVEARSVPDLVLEAQEAARLPVLERDEL
jgi:hypothetical protein